MTEEDAQSIVQTYLDRQGDATISGDLEATLGWCDLPCTLQTPQGVVVARNEAEMRAICQMFIDRLKMKRVTLMVRNCVEAGFHDADTVWGHYHTRYVAADNVLSEEPYRAQVTLRRRDDHWKISEMRFAVQDQSPISETLAHWRGGKDD